MLKEVHLGIDDTDSHDGMCTTFLATLIVDLLIKQSVRFLDFPKLIRLNPNIPYKTGSYLAEYCESRNLGVITVLLKCKQ